jgi:signal transduction histidine kinase
LRAAQELSVPLKESEVDLNVLLDSMLRKIFLQWPLIDLTSQVESGLQRVRAIRKELLQAIWNIVSNAVEAMAETGNLVIKAEDFVGENQKHWVIIRVEDSGGGISPEQLKVLFRPYQSTKAAGRGYGLWRAKHVIEKIGGRIEVESRVGVGTTFTIRLPAAVSSAILTTQEVQP